MNELQHLLDFARDIAHQAGRLTLGYYSRSIEIIDKSDGSPVTEADRQAEALIRRAIEQRFPHHGIKGEEHGIKEPAANCPYTWYIDPIDGTKSFIHGVPLYTTLLALVRDGDPVVGVIEVPAQGQQLSAASGLGAHLNGRPVRVSSVDSLERAAIMTTDSRELETVAPSQGWRPLWAACRYPRTWGDAYGYFLVASGRAEIMLDAGVNDYDVAPMPVIMREAGGAFFDWSGTETIHGGSGAATNAALRDRVVDALRKRS